MLTLANRQALDSHSESVHFGVARGGGHPSDNVSVGFAAFAVSMQGFMQGLDLAKTRLDHVRHVLGLLLGTLGVDFEGVFERHLAGQLQARADLAGASGVLALHVAHHIGAPSVLIITVDVGGRFAVHPDHPILDDGLHARFADEAREVQLVPQRIDVGNPKRKERETGCRRTAPPAAHDVLGIRPPVDIPDEQQIVVHARLVERGELHLELLNDG